MKSGSEVAVESEDGIRFGTDKFNCKCFMRRKLPPQLYFLADQTRATWRDSQNNVKDYNGIKRALLQLLPSEANNNIYYLSEQEIGDIALWIQFCMCLDVLNPYFVVEKKLGVIAKDKEGKKKALIDVSVISADCEDTSKDNDIRKFILGCGTTFAECVNNDDYQYNEKILGDLRKVLRMFDEDKNAQHIGDNPRHRYSRSLVSFRDVFRSMIPENYDERKAAIHQTIWTFPQTGLSSQLKLSFWQRPQVRICMGILVVGLALALTGLTAGMAAIPLGILALTTNSLMTGIGTAAAVTAGIGIVCEMRI